MINNSFFTKIFHPQEDEKAFSLIMKIIMVCILLSILLLAIIIYSKNLSNENQGNVTEVEKPIDSNEASNQALVITHDELVSNYKQNMIKSLEDFDGDFSKLKNKILGFDVPMEFQKLHFVLATSLDKVIYEDDKASAKSEIIDLVKENSWLEQGLNKLSNNL